MTSQPEGGIGKMLKLWQSHPEAYMRQVLQFDPWERQQEICQLIATKPRVAVYTCHGIGKTTLAAYLSLWFLNCFYNSIVITTAPTFRQVENQIWRNIRAARNKAKYNLGGKLTNTRLEMGDNWYALGVSSDKPDNVQGFHAKDILIICDEAAGIPDELFDAIEGSLTSGNIRLVLLGNPTSGSGTFYNSATSKLYASMRISVFNTPNFILNNITCTDDLYKYKTIEEVMALPLAHESLVTPAWAWGRLMTWGEDSVPYQSRVEGLFPTEDASTLLPMSWVTAAIEKEFMDEDRRTMPNGMSIGVDVARYGDDMTVLTVFRGFEHIATYEHQGKSTMKTVGLIREACRIHKYNEATDVVVIDDTGVGGGVVDRLLEVGDAMEDGQGYTVVAVNFGERADEHERYRNKKAEIYWHLREQMQKGLVKLRDDGRVYSELPSIRYSYTSTDLLMIESKDTMKKRGLRSPDYADSIALAVHGMIKYCQEGATPEDEDDDDDGGTIAGNLYNQKL